MRDFLPWPLQGDLVHLLAMYAEQQPGTYETHMMVDNV